MKQIFTLLVTCFLLSHANAQNDAQSDGHTAIPEANQGADKLVITDSTQSNTDSTLELAPNLAGKSVMIPTGFGSRRPYLFGFLGAGFPQVYTSRPDLNAAVGLGLGNFRKFVSLVAILNINNVSEVNTFSASVKIARHIAKGTSLSVGAVNFLASKKSDIGASLYIALSHAVQGMKSLTPGYSRMHFTIGAGNGRFLDNSLKDVMNGKKVHGTAVFANLGYEVFRNLNMNAEWSGINMDLFLGWRPSFKNGQILLPSINVGFADLTRYSGERARFVTSISHAIPLSKN